MAYGFWTEHGPFRLANNASTVELYEYSWNKKASVLYVEQPSGVGLSWSADEAHHSTNDEQASADNLLFLKAFFEVFPSFKQNDFYVTGESYGGHYVSTSSLHGYDRAPLRVTLSHALAHPTYHAHCVLHLPI